MRTERSRPDSPWSGLLSIRGVEAEVSAGVDDFGNMLVTHGAGAVELQKLVERRVSRVKGIHKNVWKAAVTKQEWVEPSLRV